MKIQYLFSSSNGDISLSPRDLARPFLSAPSSKAHPSLTLGDYFESIKTFILQNPARPLAPVLKVHLQKEIRIDDIQKILIRSEKHGVFYHLASVEIFIDNRRVKLAVSSALSKIGKEYLTHEYEVLDFLNSSFNLSCVPNVYLTGEVKTQVMLLAEWFEDYHEWHLSFDKKDKKQKVFIWDLKRGNRFASKEESLEIFRQASRILTLYYDTRDFRQIYPWHHAAGDFIVKTASNRIDVKLTSARRYESIMDYFSAGTCNPMIAIVYFFLNLTIKMRLDKLDGVGEIVWAGDFSVDATIDGFFEGLGAMEGEGRYKLGQVKDLLFLLKTFSKEEFKGLFQSLLFLYQENHPADFYIIQAKLGRHVQRLYQVIQEFRL
ncbi:MAG: hypothetical protein GY864_05220 [Desulfobacterales bacterium]|nr:hypothetical protein [Desulfobacterales bacterium]